ncbi:MAG: polyphosphate kinase 1 [Flavobacteriales bacterium]
MFFHDLEHTLGVARVAVAIAQAMKLKPADIVLVEMAALFHDAGYALKYSGHEEHSARLAEAFLNKHKVSARDIGRVRSLIMSTRFGAKPRSTLQMVLRDADSNKAGQADFHARSELLRRELEVVRSAPIDPRSWNVENLAYLTGHRFHTAYAQRRYGAQKRINLQDLRKRSALPERKLKPKRAKERFMDRDMSWLSFNERVLQEAWSPDVPLLERLKFLAIYSNNLDEFYRVRVASLRSLGKLNKVARVALEVPPEKLVERLNRKALEQQKEFGALYRGTLLPALAEQGIRILRETQLDGPQRKAVRTYFTDRIAALLNTASVREGNAPFIEDRKLYFVVQLRQNGHSKNKLVLLNIPAEEAGRFLRLPRSKEGSTDVVFLDDVIRFCLPGIFAGHKVLGCHAIKLSRDAELYLDEEFGGNVKDKVRKSLKKRRTGVPSRFLYDNAMPPATLRALRTLLGLAKQDVVAGGRYHNFSDLMKLPVVGHAHLRDAPWPSVDHPAFANGGNAFRTIAARDRLLHFPYHDFGALVRWLEQAAVDAAVSHIAITLYRVADGSAVCNALLKALEHGKRVTVFVEVQARFDETSNLYWGERLEKAGAHVLYSYERLKVHCKLCLVERMERGRIKRYAYLGTGNFNERTSQLYVDSALLTARESITREVEEVFAHLRDRRHRPSHEHLMVAPSTLRTRLEQLIDKEIELALSGRPARMMLKMNSLEDRAMIRKLYDASNAGVEVRIIVRGICCLVPGVKGMSENITAISIVDRYLEHTRAYVFGNNGKTLVYLSSADWMGRNLDRRIEVAFPILDQALKQVVLDILEIQWSDRTKARLIDVRQTNPYLLPVQGERPVHSQAATRAYLLAKVKGQKE